MSDSVEESFGDRCLIVFVLYSVFAGALAVEEDTKDWLPIRSFSSGH